MPNCPFWWQSSTIQWHMLRKDERNKKKKIEKEDEKKGFAILLALDSCCQCTFFFASISFVRIYIEEILTGDVCWHLFYPTSVGIGPDQHTLKKKYGRVAATQKKRARDGVKKLKRYVAQHTLLNMSAHSHRRTLCESELQMGPATEPIRCFSMCIRTPINSRQNDFLKSFC